ncbi:MAG: hypothetical protein DHS20C18_22380 [Saprospiraceae bacterium]|nr:MAG: hypothetical protein DHS20C18_22380 [Saprospiraceae bacterium]
MIRTSTPILASILRIAFEYLETRAYFCALFKKMNSTPSFGVYNSKNIRYGNHDNGRVYKLWSL